MNECPIMLFLFVSDLCYLNMHIQICSCNIYYPIPSTPNMFLIDYLPGSLFTCLPPIYINIPGIKVLGMSFLLGDHSTPYIFCFKIIMTSSDVCIKCVHSFPKAATVRTWRNGFRFKWPSNLKINDFGEANFYSFTPSVFNFDISKLMLHHCHCL